jgi:DNA replication protein DnaC
MDSTIMEVIKHEKRLKALGLENLSHCDFAHDNRQNLVATNVMREYTDNFKAMLEDGTGMFIYGNPGAGKTYAAAQIVNELTDKGYDCMFTSMSNIITELNTVGIEGKRNLFYQIFSKDLLVLDDLGSEVETSNSNQIFIQIVNTCLSKNIPIIITTPYHDETLLEGNAKRVMAISRLMRKNISFTMHLPRERRCRELQQKQKLEALVKGAASQTAFTGYGEAETEWHETTVQECLPENIQQTLPLVETEEKEE